ncbi:hypothetical protein SKAU_G00381940 [Synaphobranchus kaupii]|uniref:Uncharacterized protein n=1 Tax=Synaphobranchus kaupii TaxID=118154 RepID=A0A9Q1IES5_SYNKA|nr:hypothetical protein SKAU_G00381940 [Synaphobranchus kaupii]
MKGRILQCGPIREVVRVTASLGRPLDPCLPPPPILSWAHPPPYQAVSRMDELKPPPYSECIQGGATSDAWPTPATATPNPRRVTDAPPSLQPTLSGRAASAPMGRGGSTRGRAASAPTGRGGSTRSRADSVPTGRGGSTRSRADSVPTGRGGSAWSRNVELTL